METTLTRRDMTVRSIRMFCDADTLNEASVLIDDAALNRLNHMRELLSRDYGAASVEGGPGVLGMSARASRLSGDIAALDAVLDQLGVDRRKERARIRITETDAMQIAEELAEASARFERMEREHIARRHQANDFFDTIRDRAIARLPEHAEAAE